MIRPIPHPARDDLIPQAILAKPLSSVVRAFRQYVVEDEDDLDVYAGVALSLDDQLQFAVRHYRGHPENTATIYLEPHLRDVAEIRHVIARIVDALHIPRQAVAWQRGDDFALPEQQAGRSNR